MAHMFVLRCRFIAHILTTATVSDEFVYWSERPIESNPTGITNTVPYRRPRKTAPLYLSKAIEVGENDNTPLFRADKLVVVKMVINSNRQRIYGNTTSSVVHF